MGNRLEYVDIAKGMGLVLVVCSHSDALDLMWLMMDMCIPIFFFCSGYTFKMKGTLESSMIKKARKLLVPYVFFNLMMFFAFCHFSLRELVGIIYSRYSLYPLDVTPNIKFFTSGNYPMWYLTSMVVSYFLFYLLVYYEKYSYNEHRECSYSEAVFQATGSRSFSGSCQRSYDGPDQVLPLLSKSAVRGRASTGSHHSGIHGNH